MAEVRAFQAITYNQDKIRDLSRVVCPPYDIITPFHQEYYHSRDPHNFIHILLGKDIPGEDKYRRAADYFEQWHNSGILMRQEKPAIYFYSQTYNVKGEQKERLGFIALLRLPEQQQSVFGHEHTKLEPKEDRLNLLKQVKANLSPIFLVFADEKRIIQRIYQKQVAASPTFINITDDEKIKHRLWRLDDPNLIEEVRLKMHDEKVFIADGHHRYEVACAYRDQMRQRLENLTGEENFNYILSYFTVANSRGLTIFPIHRLVRVGDNFDWNTCKVAFKEYFDIEEVKADPRRFFFLLEKAGRIEHILGVYRDQRYWLLRLKNVKMLDRVIVDKTVEYRTLDISMFNYVVLERILGRNRDDQSGIEYIHEADEVLRRVDEDNSLIGFFLNPVKIQRIMAVALKNEKMPPKSTYFYPKVLSGLVINKF